MKTLWWWCELKMRECMNCKIKGLKFKHCSACKSVHYCSRECQKSDWKRHKKECKKVESPPKDEKKRNHSERFEDGWLNREEMIKWLKQYFEVVVKSEQFHHHVFGTPSKNAIVVPCQASAKFKGEVIYDYSRYDFIKEWVDELDKRGWFGDWYDENTRYIAPKMNPTGTWG